MSPTEIYPKAVIGCAGCLLPLIAFGRQGPFLPLRLLRFYIIQYFNITLSNKIENELLPFIQLLGATMEQPNNTPTELEMNQEKQSDSEIPAQKPKIGGFLIILGLLLGIDLLSLLLAVASSFVLAAASQEVDPDFYLYFLFLGVSNIVLLGSNLTALILFFMKKRLFKPVMIAYPMLFLAVMGLAGLIAYTSWDTGVQLDADGMVRITRYVIRCLVVIPYILLSQRVKDTFIY